MPRRIIAAALPWLAAEHRLRVEGQSGLDAPFAVVETAQGTVRLVGVNAAAAKQGLSPGQTLTDARAIHPNLLTRPAAPERLGAFRAALGRWAERFSPLVGHGHRDALILDATGCAHLFGGEEAMIAAGGRRITAVAVSGPGPALCTPCGGCRQKIREFADPDTPILICGPDAPEAEFTLDQLLPVSFGPGNRK